MKIEVTHIIKADESLLSIFGAVLSALSSQSENLTVADAVKLTPAQKEPKQTKAAEKLEVPTVADKTMYFVHEGSGEAIVVKKGEDIAFLGGDIFDPITKAEYDKIQAEQAPKETPAEEPQAETTNSEDHGITMEMIRAEATKLTSVGRQADFKAILTSFEAQKLSSVPEEKYPAFLTAIKEAVGEA